MYTLGDITTSLKERAVGHIFPIRVKVPYFLPPVMIPAKKIHHYNSFAFSTGTVNITCLWPEILPRKN